MMEPGDNCSYCMHRKSPSRMSDKEINGYSIGDDFNNPSALNTPEKKRLASSVACDKYKLLLSYSRDYRKGGCEGFREKDY